MTTYIVYEEAHITRMYRYRVEAGSPQEAIDKAGEMELEEALGEPREKCYDYSYSVRVEG